MAEEGRPRTPLTVIAGGLGTGKTTLLRRLLAGDHGRLAVIVNEFGEIGIDGELLRGEAVELVELAGGCVCCTLAGELEVAVAELIERVAPEAIVLEATGVAEADALAVDLDEELPGARLDALVTLVDADISARHPELGYAERAQVEAADLLVLNKADLVDAATLAAVGERLRAVNARAPVLTARFADIDPRLLLPGTERPPRPRERAPQATPQATTQAAAPAAGHGMESFAWRPPGALAGDCLAAALEAWPSAVYRAKGRVVVDGEPRLLSYVAGRWSLEPVAAGPPGLVWIGPGVGRHREALVAGLERCLQERGRGP